MVNVLYLCNLLWGGNGLGEPLQLRHDHVDGVHDATADLHRVGPLADGVEALLGDGTRQHRGGGGAVASLLIGVVGHVLYQLGADVLVAILEVDALGHGHAILGDLGAAPALLDDHRAALRWETAEWISDKMSFKMRPRGTCYSCWNKYMNKIYPKQTLAIQLHSAVEFEHLNIYLKK